MCCAASRKVTAALLHFSTIQTHSESASGAMKNRAFKYGKIALPLKFGLRDCILLGEKRFRPLLFRAALFGKHFNEGVLQS